MVIFHCYVSLPEGIRILKYTNWYVRLREAFPWPAWPLKHTEFIFFNYIHLYKYTNGTMVFHTTSGAL